MLSANEDRWDAIVLAAASSENVPPAIVKAVIWNETRFAWLGDPHPVTGRPVTAPADLDREEPRIGDASVGVMQLLTQTAAWIVGRPVTREELREPTFNIYLGTRLLSAYLHGWRPGDGGTRIEGAARPFDVDETLAAYNGGPGAVQRRRPDGSFPNQSYVTTGLRAYDYFQSVAVAAPPTTEGEPSPPPAAAAGSEPGGASTLPIILVGALLVGAALVLGLRD